MKPFLLTLLTTLLFCSSSAYAQVARITVMSERQYEPADRSFGPVLVPGGVNFARVVFDTKDRLQVNSTMTVVLERSLNGGMTWEPSGGAVRLGEKGKKGVEGLTVVLPEPGNAGRMLRGRFTLVGGTLKTAVFVVLE
jgi:hypothetical protein